MEIPMTSPRGVADARSLGVDPKPMREVLGAEGLAAPLVEVEVREHGARDVGRHLLGDLDVAGADRDVVERDDAGERVARPSPAAGGCGG